jgi:hypothetical protein
MAMLEWCVSGEDRKSVAHVPPPASPRPGQGVGMGENSMRDGRRRAEGAVGRAGNLVVCLSDGDGDLWAGIPR